MSGLQEGVPNRLPDLIARHPTLFRGQPPRCHSYLLEGWYELVDRLCSDLEVLLGDRADQFEVVQVKEKLATLRFYWSLGGRSQLVADLFGVRRAGAMSPTGPDEEGYTQRAEDTLAGTRVTLTPDNDISQKVAARVREAEAASASICETCGTPGRVRVTRKNYFFVACAKHTPRGAVLFPTWRRRQEERAAADAKAKKEGGDD